MFNHLQARKREVPKGRPTPGSGEGADSAFGRMIEDRPLVHRPESAPDPEEKDDVHSDKGKAAKRRERQPRHQALTVYT